MSSSQLLGDISVPPLSLLIFWPILSITETEKLKSPVIIM